MGWDSWTGWPAPACSIARNSTYISTSGTNHAVPVHGSAPPPPQYTPQQPPSGHWCAARRASGVSAISFTIEQYARPGVQRAAALNHSCCSKGVCRVERPPVADDVPISRAQHMREGPVARRAGSVRLGEIRAFSKWSSFTTWLAKRNRAALRAPGSYLGLLHLRRIHR